MAELTVENTYGKAIFEAAKDMGKVELIYEELSGILTVFQHEPDLYEFFNTPVISGSEKKEAIEQIFAGQISDETLNFLCILIDKRRTVGFDRMVRVYKNLLDQKSGISTGTIFSVEPLTDIQLSNFEEKTGSLLKENVKLANKIDASILGGVKIFIDGKIIDASIRKRLKDLEGSIKRI